MTWSGMTRPLLSQYIIKSKKIHIWFSLLKSLLKIELDTCSKTFQNFKILQNYGAYSKKKSNIHESFLNQNQ